MQFILKICKLEDFPPVNGVCKSQQQTTWKVNLKNHSKSCPTFSAACKNNLLPIVDVVAYYLCTWDTVADFALVKYRGHIK